jgi:hypothetical protein
MCRARNTTFSKWPYLYYPIPSHLAPDTNRFHVSAASERPKRDLPCADPFGSQSAEHFEWRPAGDADDRFTESIPRRQLGQSSGAVVVHQDNRSRFPHQIAWRGSEGSRLAMLAPQPREVQSDTVPAKCSVPEPLSVFGSRFERARHPRERPPPEMQSPITRQVSKCGGLCAEVPLGPCAFKKVMATREERA